MADALAALEERAREAEARLSAIESSIAASAAGASSSGGSLPSSHVSDLNELRALLVKAKEESDAVAAERDQAIKAKAAAEEEITKLKYRILHLTRAVRDADKAQGRT